MPCTDTMRKQLSVQTVLSFRRLSTVWSCLHTGSELGRGLRMSLSVNLKNSALPYVPRQLSHLLSQLQKRDCLFCPLIAKSLTTFTVKYEVDNGIVYPGSSSAFSFLFLFRDTCIYVMFCQPVSNNKLTQWQPHVFHMEEGMSDHKVKLVEKRLLTGLVVNCTLFCTMKSYWRGKVKLSHIQATSSTWLLKAI